MEIGENRSLPLEDSRTGEILMSLTQCFESIYYIYLQHDAFYSPVQGGQATGVYSLLIEKTQTTLVHPSDRALYGEMLALAPLRARMGQEGYQEFEYQRMMPDGTYRWVRNQVVVARRDPQGRPLTATLFTTDIQAQKARELEARQQERAAECALEAERMRMKLLAEASNAIVITRDQATNCTRVLRAIHEKDGSTHYQDESYQDAGQIRRQNVYPDDWPRLQAMLTQGIGLGELFELRGRRQPDKEYVWFRVQGKGVYDKQGRLVRVVATMEDIDQEKRMELEFKHRSELDLATGAYNKATAMHKIERRLAKQSRKRGLFLLLDLDDFKTINDTYGHVEGDRVIRESARLLKELFGPRDIIGRMGGDELCVFCEEEPGLQQVYEYFDKICAGMHAVVTQGEHVTSCSIGASLCEGQDKPFEQLYREADKALYEQKRRGKDGGRVWGYFDEA